MKPFYTRKNLRIIVNGVSPNNKTIPFLVSTMLCCRWTCIERTSIKKRRDREKAVGTHGQSEERTRENQAETQGDPESKARMLPTEYTIQGVPKEAEASNFVTLIFEEKKNFFIR